MQREVRPNRALVGSCSAFTHMHKKRHTVANFQQRENFIPPANFP